MPASIGVNLRVTGHCRQGGRKYMEDFFSVAYQQTEDERDLEYAFFGIYDGHGGAEAAAYAKEHLMETIVRHKNFWSDNDTDVLRAIKDGYIATHYAMWREQEKWPKTASGLPSTAGTTASVAFIRKGKIYIGHVGDSGIILGYQDEERSDWKAKPLTKDHKPESALEMLRIERCGGKVLPKSGVHRVVWNRPRIGHQGPVRRSTPIDEIPFLAVARSLGDLWSYNSQLDEFIVSPDPDCSVIPIDTDTFRCLIFGTDGLFNMLSPQMAVHIVQQAERHNEDAALSDSVHKLWLNPSKCLVEKALERWATTKMRADNTSVVTLMLDPPGPPRLQVLRNKRRSCYPDSGLQIVTRYEQRAEMQNRNEVPRDSESGMNKQAAVQQTCPEDRLLFPREQTVSDSTYVVTSLSDVPISRDLHSDATVPTTTIGDCITSSDTVKSAMYSRLTEVDPFFKVKTRESTTFEVNCGKSAGECVPRFMSSNFNIKKSLESDQNIQINEISSSSSDTPETCDNLHGVDANPVEKRYQKAVPQRKNLRLSTKTRRLYMEFKRTEKINVNEVGNGCGRKRTRSQVTSEVIDEDETHVDNAKPLKRRKRQSAVSTVQSPEITKLEDVGAPRATRSSVRKVRKTSVKKDIPKLKVSVSTSTRSLGTPVRNTRSSHLRIEYEEASPIRKRAVTLSSALRLLSLNSGLSISEKVSTRKLRGKVTVKRCRSLMRKRSESKGQKASTRASRDSCTSREKRDENVKVSTPTRSSKRQTDKISKRQTFTRESIQEFANEVPLLKVKSLTKPKTPVKSSSAKMTQRSRSMSIGRRKLSATNQHVDSSEPKTMQKLSVLSRLNLKVSMLSEVPAIEKSLGSKSLLPVTVPNVSRERSKTSFINYAKKLRKRVITKV